MRIKLKQKINPILGDKRIIEKFLWFPEKLNSEIRWLEKSKIEQEYCEVAYIHEDINILCSWKNLRFVD